MGKKVGDLREIAKVMGIPSPYKLKKDELIHIIMNPDGDEDEEVEAELEDNSTIDISQIQRSHYGKEK